MAKARKHSKKLICLITDGFSNGKNPVPIAQRLKSENITIVTFGNVLCNCRSTRILYLFFFFVKGIQMGNYAELYNISSHPGEEHSFLLDSFAQFESMARKALHNGITLHNSSFLL